MTLPLFERPALLDVKPTSLRRYQTSAIQTLRTRVREEKKRVLLVGPTGMGKMVIIASIIQTSSVPVLFVAHRMELIDQAAAQLARLGITNIGVMRGDDDRTNPNAATQIASIQTLIRRKKPEAGLILIDEAHRSLGDSYQKHIFEAYPNAIILGFTATPCRLDGKPLGSVYQTLEVVATYAELIREGWIAVPDCYSTPVSPDLSSVRVVAGEYDEGQLEDVMRKQELVGNVVDHWLKLAHLYPKPGGGYTEGPRRRTFIFATSIAHSLDICERFSASGVRVAHLDGTTQEDERRRIVRALGEGELDAISNCNVMLEGVDVPSAKCVVHARPTQSLVLWRQSTGRILRPWHPGCPLGCTEHPSVAPLLLDHAGNIDRHGFPHEDLHWELNAKAFRASPPKTKICKGCFAYVDSNRSVCPFCGFEFKQQDHDPPKPVKETAEKLIQRSTQPEDMKRAFLDDMVKVARKRGFKPGFASAKFKEHYGHWPPWAWSEEIKASFASDSEWISNFESRDKRKKNEEEKIKVEEEKAVEADLENDAQEDPTTDEGGDDESFGDWYGKQ